MAETIIQDGKNSLAHKVGNIYSKILTVWLLITLSIFPLFYDNYYYNILDAKYVFYYVSVLIMLGVFLITTVIFAVIDQSRYAGYNRKRILNNLSPENLWKNSTAAGKWLIAFLILVIISTLQSDYLYEAFWGNEGRYSGLFLISLYIFSTILIVKFARVKKWYLEVFLLIGVLVCLFGITDYFKMDIMHFKVNASSKDKEVFTSTIGNVNTYTAYVALLIGVGSGFFGTEKNVVKAFFQYIMVMISFFAMITGQSDNAYLALGALFALLPLHLFKSRGGVKRYALLVTGFVTAIKIIAVISNNMGNRVVGITGIFHILADYDKLLYIVIAMWAMVIVLYIGDLLLFKHKEDKIEKWLCLSWGGILLLAAIFVCYIMYDANFGPNPWKYGALTPYVVFQDNWGTNRGYCWRIAWETYKELPLHHKLFGFGPDTFGILTFDYRAEAVQSFGYYFESAHNEYLQYLVTIGPFGLVSYLAFLGSGCWTILKRMGKRPWLTGPMLAVVCYAVQAIVNINLPTATPIMWLLLAIGLSVCHQMKKEEEQSALVKSAGAEDDSCITENTDTLKDDHEAVNGSTGE